LVEDLPYPSFTLAVVDDYLPGGHSPAYFALVHQPLPATPYSWRNDPVAFEGFPQFFLAHEVAHQFWGQAVGWKSYHEQWISEGLAQYFAYLYAERTKGAAVARDVLRQMRRSALQFGDEGPVWLGYRLGHIKADSRVFRAVVYNKGALVLHMLRRLVGEEPFFRALRRFYRSSRFRKVGTDDLQRAFEAETGRELGRFFDPWILQAGAPTVTWHSAVEDGAVRVTFRQEGTAHVLPLTVTLTYGSGETEDVVVVLDGPAAEHRLPLRGDLRAVAVNDDAAALARVERR